jgi:bacterioferritin-associated ferredoxin
VSDDLQRLQRIADARRAGIDTERDLCAHGYVNGSGCAECARLSRQLMAALWIPVLLLVLFLVWSLKGGS